MNKILFLILSLALISACSKEPKYNPAFDIIKKDDSANDLTAGQWAAVVSCITRAIRYPENQARRNQGYVTLLDVHTVHLTNFRFTGSARTGVNMSLDVLYTQHTIEGVNEGNVQSDQNFCRLEEHGYSPEKESEIKAQKTAE